MRHYASILIASVFLFVLATGAFAQITMYKHLEFDVDGVLPSADSDVEFRNQFAAALEPSIFSVSGGVLRGDSMPSVNNYVGYAWPNALLTGSIPSNAPVVIEARLRILEANQYNVNSPLGSIWLWTGQRRWFVYHTLDEIRAARSNGSYAAMSLDISQWHTVRMEGIGGWYDVYVDGALLESGIPAAAEALNGWQIQLTDSYSGAVVEWDYVRFEAGPDAVAIEQSTWGGIKALHR